MRNLLRLLPLVLLPFTATACLHGHEAFRASHAHHNEALRTRIDEELLLNLVRLRYRDSPLFLQVGSVVTQFEIRGALGASGSIEESGPDSLGLSASVGWSEKPTYTFTPLQDDEFVRRLLTPMDLEVVVLLQRSGWSIERVLRLTVQNLGGLENAVTASGPTPARAPEFESFLATAAALRQLQLEGRIQFGFEERTSVLSSPVAAGLVEGADVVSAATNGYRFEPVEGASSALQLTQAKQKPTLYVSAQASEGDELQALQQELGLAPGRVRYDITSSVDAGAVPAGGRESLGIATRSLLGTFFYLSQGIDIPEEHLEDGLVTITRDAGDELFDWHRMTGDLFRVRSSSKYPKGAAIAVPYRDHWYYIEDSDLDTKSTFTLLLELFSMSSGVTFKAAPALTLPIGG